MATGARIRKTGGDGSVRSRDCYWVLVPWKGVCCLLDARAAPFAPPRGGIATGSAQPLWPCQRHPAVHQLVRRKSLVKVRHIGIDHC